MSSERLFLHETLDPVPVAGAHTRYLEQLGEVVRTEGNADGSAGGICIAAWVPIFLTGRWPQIVTFWEMPNGWDGFAEHFDHNAELFHGPLERWYGERSGGFDRVMTGSAQTPSGEELRAGGMRAPVVLQETVKLQPGSSAEYLAALELAAPEVGAAHGPRLVGAYDVAFRRESEALVLWAFDDVQALAGALRRDGSSRPFARWSKRAAEYEITHRALALRPTSWSPLR